MTSGTVHPIAHRYFALTSVALALAACEKSKTETEQLTTIPTAPSATTQPSAETATPSASAPAIKKIPAPSDVATPPADAKKTASGLVTKVLTPGTGKDKPKPNQRVKFHHTGWNRRGEMFDSSMLYGQPAVFGVTQVIKGWSEALQMMVVGEKRRLWVPAKLAYEKGEIGDLTFDLELLEIMEAAKPPPVPKDVKAPPADATKTASGLAYKVLRKGTGKEHPTAASHVVIHYTGWTSAGKMFDSSVVRAEPGRVGLEGVIKGWAEGIQLMTVGETTRFWIPSKLAYGEKPTESGLPAGSLVFDIELISIH